MTIPNLGTIGIWSMELRFGDASQIADAAAEIEALGFGALWVPGGIGGDICGDLDRLLAATSRITIATGIINIWKHEPAEIADWWHALPPAHQSRLMLGLGISHGPLIGDAWAKPLAKMRDYLVQLTALGLPANNLCLAALGPKMVALSGEQTAGAHPYLVTPEHTAEARAILGPGKLLMPEQGVILATGPDTVRTLGHKALEHYGRLPNYRNNWLRLGFSEAEIDAQSDRLLNALFASGMDAIKARLDAHFAAGADHVCLQAITDGKDGIAGALAAYRELAAMLTPA